MSYQNNTSNILYVKFTIKLNFSSNKYPYYYYLERFYEQSKSNSIT